MFRLRPVLLAILLVSGAAGAHTLPDDAPLAEQVAHPFVSLHHLPVLLLGAILLVAAIGTLGRLQRRTKRGPD